MAGSCLPASPWNARTFPSCLGSCFFSYPCCLKETNKTKGVLSIPLYQFPESSHFICFWARRCYFCISPGSLGEQMPEDRTGRPGLCPAQPGRQRGGRLVVGGLGGGAGEAGQNHHLTVINMSPSRHSSSRHRKRHCTPSKDSSYDTPLTPHLIL